MKDIRLYSALGLVVALGALALLHGTHSGAGGTDASKTNGIAKAMENRSGVANHASAAGADIKVPQISVEGRWQLDRDKTLKSVRDWHLNRRLVPNPSDIATTLERNRIDYTFEASGRATIDFYMDPDEWSNERGKWSRVGTLVIVETKKLTSQDPSFVGRQMRRDWVIEDDQSLSWEDTNSVKWYLRRVSAE